MVPMQMGVVQYAKLRLLLPPEIPYSVRRVGHLNARQPLGARRGRAIENVLSTVSEFRKYLISRV